jgi:hypothetical protein
MIADFTRKSNRLIHFRPDLNATYLNKLTQLGQIDNTIDESHPSTPSAVQSEPG